MQRIAQRTRLAEREVGRRLARKEATEIKDSVYEKRQEEQSKRMVLREYVKEERNYRREAWMAGPRLAPRRDYGKKAEDYGTIDQLFINAVKVTKRDKEGVKTWLAEGDRVVLLDGRDRGRITPVTAVDEDSQTVQVKGLMQTDFKVPEYMRMEDQDPRPIAPIATNIPWNKVKLVFAVRDAKKKFRDVLVDKIIVKLPSPLEKATGADERGTRIIPGLNVIIPWPQIEKTEHEDNDCDTLPMEVEGHRTDKNYLLGAPMPPSVIDELRNKYSRFRTRHSPTYIATKEWETSLKDKKIQLLAQSVTMPSEELQEMNKARREANEKELSDEQLAVIGEAMERERQRSPGTQGARTA